MTPCLYGNGRKIPAFRMSNYDSVLKAYDKRQKKLTGNYIGVVFAPYVYSSGLFTLLGSLAVQIAVTNVVRERGYMLNG
ncbi:hypothetical protein D3C76_257010 [compost metagenome]